jgi:uncharacterized membrane protein
MPLWFTVTLIVTGGVVVTGLIAYLIDRSNHV